MLNFALGAIAGAVTAGVLTIAAARQPDIQSRLGLIVPQAPVAAAVAPPADTQCPPARAAPKLNGAAQDILFNKQRFWSVNP